MKELTILYLDDEPLNAKVFEMAFGKKHHVMTVLSSKEAFLMLDKTHEINVVFSDMKMPDMDGLEFIKMAKKINEYADYFILTGFTLTPLIEEAKKDGIITDFFAKPFNIKEINKMLSEIQNQ